MIEVRVVPASLDDGEHTRYVPIPFGPKVENLEQAKLLVEVLEWLHNQRELTYQSDAHLPAVEWLLALDCFEGSSVEAHDLNSGRIWVMESEWEEVDQEPIAYGPPHGGW